MTSLNNYAKGIEASEEVLAWLNTTGKKTQLALKASNSDIEHILDYLVSPAAPKRLQKMSFKDAKRKAKEWSDANQKKGCGFVDGADDIETIHDFFDGTRIVRLRTKKAFQREGFLMNHCVGGYSVTNNDQHIYSYRDVKNMPHATFEVRKVNNEIVQIKGKGNGPIHPKYIHPILEFLRTIGLTIRPNDMVNLGYYHIDKEHIEFLRRITSASKQIVMISGETYAF